MSAGEPLTREPVSGTAAPPAASPTPIREDAAEAADEGTAAAEAHPRGALLISLLYVTLLGGLWGYMYLLNVRAG